MLPTVSITLDITLDCSSAGAPASDAYPRRIPPRAKDRAAAIRWTLLLAVVTAAEFGIACVGAVAPDAIAERALRQPARPASDHHVGPREIDQPARATPAGLWWSLRDNGAPPRGKPH